MPFSPLPLGQRIPAKLHGVSCSLPTMRAVIGYEEKDPAIVQHLSSGYPRFVQHPILKRAGAHLLKHQGLDNHYLWLTASLRSADALQRWLAPEPATVISHLGLHGVAVPLEGNSVSRAKTWLQHTGALASSRAAEDYLVRVGERSAVDAEETYSGNSRERVLTYLLEAYMPATDDDVFLANSGMNAIWAAYRAVSALQAPRGRRVWVQLGWLYLDTIAILQKFSGGAENYVLHSNVFDLEGLKRLFTTRGHEIAGVITEVPTNPLLQTPDLAAVYELCRASGALLVVDPTVASPLNINVLPHADLVVNSLTKYTASEGDVLFGAVVVKPGHQDSVYLRAQLTRELEPIYPRDLARLAAQIDDTASVVQKTNETAARVVAFLQSHPRIASLYWPLRTDSAENYQRLARGCDRIGSMVSFTVKGSLSEFYDRLRLPKGPSFGMKTSLICPFIYLAHYDLVTSVEGQKILAANDLSPELLRLSVGCEPAEEIIAALEEALS